MDKGGLRQVDAQAAFEILDEIRDTFPSEFAQARQVIRERQALLDEAEAQASRLIEDARARLLPCRRTGNRSLLSSRRHHLGGST